MSAGVTELDQLAHKIDHGKASPTFLVVIHYLLFVTLVI